MAGQGAPFGTDLIFAADDLADFIFHIEICEDFWAPQPPSTVGALAGATILCNLSASNIVIGKADERHMLCASSPTRCIAAYVYSAAGPGESTTDLAWDGQGSIYELGDLLAEASRFAGEQLAVADIDVQRLRLERMRTPTFNDAAAAGHPARTAFRRVAFDHRPRLGDVGLDPPIRRFPFVPNRPEQLDQDCYEAFNIQVQRACQAHPGDEAARHHGHRRLGRARFDPRADRRRQGLRLARPAALDHPRLHHARLRHRRGHQVATPGS